MPGVVYRGLAARFVDPKFAWKFFTANIILGIVLTIVMIKYYATDQSVEKINTCFTREIEWEEFLKHSCATKDLWLVIGGHVYDMWLWGNLIKKKINANLNNNY